MNSANKHLFSWLIRRSLISLLKKHKLREAEFETLVLIKYIYDRRDRATYIKDVQTLIHNSLWRAYEIVYSLERLGYVIIDRRLHKWAGKARIEVSLSPLGNELLEKIRLASESKIACIKHQLDSEKNLVNKAAKKKIRTV